jgi:circadian clock protein KaiC
MKTALANCASPMRKTATGVAGFDEITGGGLPTGRTTLLAGGPGSGKTIFSLQYLVRGVALGEPGIFVAFEEGPERIRANADGFAWKLADIPDDQLRFIDAQPSADMVQSGNFDFGGLLAVLQSQCVAMGARRIVFDALDILLSLLPDNAARRREVYRLHAWLLEHELTGIITAKAGGNETSTEGDAPFGFMQFMVDCAVVLNHCVVLGVSQRNLRVQKFRGSSFDENESPFVIGVGGFEVAVANPLGRGVANVSKERVSSGVDRLDTMLGGGGYYRGATVLITGHPGTAKTTLSGAFSQAACERGEQTLFVSFDADSNEVARDLSSVGIHLQPYIASGRLRMISARTVTGSAETYLVRIKTLARDHGARCVVIDPVSTWASDRHTAHSVAERLIDWSKSEGITLLCTSLPDDSSERRDAGNSLHISTLADTWIHVDYLVQAGERNRGLSIIKSRGTVHSNQVRELILGNDGVTLADIYTAGGEVLMGTLRWEKEGAERLAVETSEISRQLEKVRLDAEEAVLEVRMKSLQTELAAKQLEKALLTRTAATQERQATREESHLRELRGADTALEKRP